MGRTACTEPQCLYSTAIPLLPLWALRPVQSLIACTVQLYLYSPYGPYGLYRASVPVQYSYTPTPAMGFTACTEPQCLYKGALYLFSLPFLQDLICIFEAIEDLTLDTVNINGVCKEIIIWNSGDMPSNVQFINILLLTHNCEFICVNLFILTHCFCLLLHVIRGPMYRGADKTLARPERKESDSSFIMVWNFLRLLALQEKGTWWYSRLDAVEIARVSDMLPSLFPSCSG